MCNVYGLYGHWSVHLIVIDKYLSVPLPDFHFNIAYVNVLETELWHHKVFYTVTARERRLLWNNT